MCPTLIYGRDNPEDHKFPQWIYRDLSWGNLRHVMNEDAFFDAIYRPLSWGALSRLFAMMVIGCFRHTLAHTIPKPRCTGYTARDRGSPTHRFHHRNPCRTTSGAIGHFLGWTCSKRLWRHLPPRLGSCGSASHHRCQGSWSIQIVVRPRVVPDPRGSMRCDKVRDEEPL